MDFAASPSLEGGKETVTSLLPRRRRLPESRSGCCVTARKLWQSRDWVTYQVGHESGSRESVRLCIRSSVAATLYCPPNSELTCCFVSTIQFMCDCFKIERVLICSLSPICYRSCLLKRSSLYMKSIRRQLVCGFYMEKRFDWFVLSSAGLKTSR